jgi:hypothetical protein
MTTHGTGRGRRALGASLFVLLPAFMIITFLFIERALGDYEGHPNVIGGLSETKRRGIEMSIEMAKWFTGLATLLIGGVSYYVKAAAKEFRGYTGRSKAAAVGAVIFSILSIYFGQLWLTGIRSQLAYEYYEQEANSVRWPENLQFFFFITGLCWFGLFALDRERARKFSEPPPPVLDVAD